MRADQRILVAAIVLLILTCAAASTQDAPSSPVHFRKIVLTTQFYSEGANVGDFDRDGHTDIVAGPFWYAGPDFRARHAFITEAATQSVDPHGYSKNFFAFVDDLNGDSFPDILIVGFPGEAAFWYENPGASNRSDAGWTRHLILDHVDDESPTYLDLLGDGKRELVCIHDNQLGYATRDANDASKPWRFHPISPKSDAFQRFTHGLGVGDVNGDGSQDMLEKDGWWQQPANLSEDAPWQHHKCNFGDGGAQMYAVDVNGDRVPDVITSLSAHGYGLAWFQGPAMTKHLIIGSKPEDSPQRVAFSQLHAVAVADIDGDGLLDIVTGKRHWAHGPEHDPEPNAPAVLYWFQAKRNPSAPGGVEFFAHQIDDDSGVGTQLVVADVNGDGRPDIVVGNKKGAFVFVQE